MLAPRQCSGWARNLWLLGLRRGHGGGRCLGCRLAAERRAAYRGLRYTPLDAYGGGRVGQIRGGRRLEDGLRRCAGHRCLARVDRAGFLKS